MFLEWLSANSVHWQLAVNEHRLEQISVSEYIANNHHLFCDVPQELQDQMVKLDTIVELRVYDETPIGFYTTYGVSVTEVIKTTRRRVIVLGEYHE